MGEEYSLSVVIPLYNEEETVRECFLRVNKVFEELACRKEVIFVNDGSRDRTFEILKELKGDDENIRLINLSRNFGHQAAISAGMDLASGDALVVMDGDLQDPPEIIPLLVESWRNGADIVHARRRKREGETVFKKLTASLYYRVMRNLADVDLPVDVGDFRLMSRRALDAFKKLRERHRYIRGLVAWLGFRQEFVDYDRDRRYAGKTHFSLIKMLSFSIDGIVSFSYIPLRLATLLGFACSIGGFLYAVYALYIKFAIKTAIPGWTSIIMVVLLIGGIQLICLGIFGEYLGKLTYEMKRRPLYIIEEIS